MTDDSDTFIREVDEGLRQDRTLTALKRYGPYLAGAAIAVLIGVGGWQAWDAYTTNAARAQADAFNAALQLANEGDLDAAKASFERLAGEGPASYRVMAQMELAAILAAQGDLQGAIAGYDEAAEAARDETMAKTAQLRAAYLVADTQDFQALRTRLQALIAEGGPISFLAQELLAVEAWEAGDAELARGTLENLQLAFDAPESVRERAGLALAVVGPAPNTEQEDAAEAPAEGEQQ